jgi:penicillin G amidase
VGTRQGPTDLAGALPELRGRVAVPGLRASADVWRDPEGIPHVQAASAEDAFLAQGFVHAQDRLWHMHADRRRALGRWAEYLGPMAVPQDVQMRRFRLEASARADWATLNGETQAMLRAYAAGVNAYRETAPALPLELQLLDDRPEPWEPWHSLVVFKVRHVLMGTWQTKAWRARLLRHLGPGLAAQLCPGTQTNPMLIVPPGVEYDGPATDGLAVLTEGEAALAHLPEWEQGSNNWALAGWRTASGKPLVAGDPHRPLEVPNVFYQNHVACPEFDAIGLSFPGVPGFPHFGHNRVVCWCVTHTAADYQDLYLERFDPADPRRYRFQEAWREARVTRETIGVRGGPSVPIDVVETHHGPVVLGDPKSGYALACRYTATAEPNRTFEALRPMLRAASADELEAAMRPWVDPVNNLVFADTGTIGYRTRGVVPLRAAANAWLPVPGWDGRHEWAGAIPFEAMPAVRDPATGYVVTANSRVTGPEYPHHLGLDFAPDFRTRRLVALLAPLRGATAEDMGRLHTDRVSLPARELVSILAALPPPDVGAAAWARLHAWDGAMDRDSVAATIYAATRERLFRELMTPLLGPLAGEAFAGAPRGAVAHMTRLKARLGTWIRADDRRLLGPGADWATVLGRAFHGAVTELRASLGEDVGGWRWGRLHVTRPRHPLSAIFPEWAPCFDPSSVALGGDGDTVQAALFTAGAGYEVWAASVARYVFDLDDWDRSGWIVPLGASGHPGSPHYADQAGPWSDGQLRPMRYGWSRIRADAVGHQVLDPGRPPGLARKIPS